MLPSTAIASSLGRRRERSAGWRPGAIPGAEDDGRGFEAPDLHRHPPQRPLTQRGTLQRVRKPEKLSLIARPWIAFREETNAQSTLP